MRIAFAIMKLFPGGGLQRDCVEIARRCRERGHDAVIFTSFRDDGDLPAGDSFAKDLPVVVLPVRRSANHRMLEEFGASFRFAAAVQQFDLRVGFDKLPGLDVLYCADPSIRARMLRQPFRFLIPRYRAYLALERAAFAPACPTRVLLLSDRQRDGYRNAWGAPPERLSLLPPTVSSARRRPEHRRNGVRDAVRADLGLTAQDVAWLVIGVQPRTKGFDRTLQALREFPQARLLIAGLGETSTRAAARLAAQARRMGLAHRVSFLGHREDIPDLMAAADLLVHPARHDTTGTVILEAVVNGLPVIATAVCGYARHVADAGAGLVIAAPFRRRALAAALRLAEDAALRSRWSAAGEQYGAQPFLYEGRMRAAEIILATAAARTRAPSAPRMVGLAFAARRADQGL
jgi:UDP-glucose:(heptosyl)LPS alpha-1,3-glucosyltransferase